MRSETANTSGESGSVLPLSAAIVGAVLLTMTWLSIDTNRVYEGRLEAHKIADQACSAAAPELPITSNVVEMVAAQVAGLDTQLGDGEVNLTPYIKLSKINIVSPTPLNDAGSPGTLFGPAKLISVFGHDNCPASVCSFSGDVEDGSITPGYINGFWDNTKHNGYVACEVEVEVKTVLSSTRLAMARVAYLQRTFGPRLPGNAVRGVTVAIAPQVDTYDDQRFKFSQSGLDDFNPLVGLNTPGDTSDDNQAFTGERKPCSGCLEGSLSGAPGNPIFANNTPLGWNTQEHKEQVQHCSNPFTAVRNGLVQSLMARLARNHETRHATEVLFASARDVNATAAQNAPVIAIERGEDLIAPNYELPFVNIKDGVNSTCPFDGCSGVPSAAMLIASQARDCMYVYNQKNGAQSITDEGIINSHYEPTSFGETASMAIPPYESPNPPDSWGFTGDITRLNAEQLVSIIPNVEQCPSSAAGPCLKPIDNADSSQAAVGLRPSIVSIMQYLNGNAGAYSSPGVLGLPSGVTYPANPDTAPQAAGANSQVVIFLSKRLDPDGTSNEKNLIRQQVRAIAPGRRITVVYTPTTLADASKDALEDLQFAFNIPLEDEDLPPSPHMVIRVAPPMTASGLVVCTAPEDECFRDYWEALLLNGASIGGESITLEQLGRTIANRVLQTEVAL